jgi:chromosome segregation ATPase
MDYYGRILFLEARVVELQASRESCALEAERERARRAAAEGALYRVQHAPKNVKALKNIAKRYFKGRTPTIVATLEHRTKELQKAEARVAELEDANRYLTSALDTAGDLLGDAEARVAKLEAFIVDACREKTLHGSTPSLIAEASKLGIAAFETWWAERAAEAVKP